MNREAAYRHGTDVAALLQRAVALQSRRRFSQAEPLYRAVLEAEPQNITALGNLGALLVECDRQQAAAPILERYLALRPHSAEGYESLGTVYAELGRREEAAALYAKALKFQNAQAWTLSAVVDLYLTLRRPGEAIAILQDLRTQPVRAAEASSQLANVLLYVGDLDGAQTAIDRALALEPNNPQHYRILAAINTFSPGDRAIAAMESLLGRRRDAAGAAMLRFALAKAYADTGAHERSFALLCEANRLVRAASGYDEAKELDVLTRPPSIFTPALMAAKADLSHSHRAPVFILGMPRSGTTLVEQILASHPKMSGAGECTAFGDSLKAVVPDFPATAVDLSGSQIGALAQRYEAAMAALLGESEHTADKFLGNAVYAGVIQMVFPRARFVHVMRDPVDTCLSCFATAFAGQPFAYDLGEMGRYWRAYDNLMAHWHRVLTPGSILMVRYEALVADLESQARRLLAHCGLDWDEACLAFDKTARFVWTASAAQVRRPLYRSAVGRWRPPADLLQPLTDALAAPPVR